MMIKTLINNRSLIVLFLLLSNLVFSQGLKEVPLHSNQVLISKWEEAKNTKAYFFRPHISAAIDLNTTQFLDDFSNNGPFPDTTLWLDCSVFVNRNYPVAPPTIGVATFDGVNSHGYPYNFQAGITSSQVADTLTSKRILLNLKTPADSIYLSFYCQPQGRGNSPEPADSLVLEFRETLLDSVHINDTLGVIHQNVPIWNPTQQMFNFAMVDSFIVHSWDSVFIKEVWQHMWSSPGSLLPSDSSWKQVMIPITDTAFFKSTFQFRFKNYATVSGNGDQWNLDNVYLNFSRTQHDTILQDMAFVYDLPSLLHPYYSMPWRHYDTAFMKHSLITYYRNNDLVTYNVTRVYSLFDPSGAVIFTNSPGDSWNDTPYYLSGYYNYNIPALPMILDTITVPSAYKFEIDISSTTGNIIHQNDTLRHVQSFSNYFAYDDGTAESAFALNATLIGEVAEKFTTTVPDSLQAIDIYFNPLWHDASLYEGAFNLRIWADAGGQPGGVIFNDTSLTPWYNHIEFAPDHFKRFRIPPQFMNPSTFFIGFFQNTSQELSIGVDKNTNSQDKIYYNTTGIWYNSPYSGSLMMRPVFGTWAECSGVAEATKSTLSLSVYPNPANDKLFLKYNSSVSEKLAYSIMDMFGRTILANQLSGNSSDQAIDISTLSEGVYFVRLSCGQNTTTSKFIKIK